MAPMVATVAEAADFAEQVRGRGLKAGVMVEVPSAALLADRMLEVVDFLSIGTNDLTQYTMAADRLASDLAHLTDPWQPAVLQLIATTAEAGRRGRQVGRHLRRGRRRPAARGRAGRHGDHLPVDGRRGGPRGRRPAVRRSALATCEEAARAALAAADPMAGRRRARRPRLTARLGLSGSTVTLMASPFLTIANASRTSSSGTCRVMRSLTGT